MKTKISKRLLSAFLAVLMVISAFASLPFTTTAADFNGTITSNSKHYSAGHDASQNRYNGTSVTICNDGAASNFCSASWYYDLSVLPTNYDTLNGTVSIVVESKESEAVNVSIYAIYEELADASNTSTASAVFMRLSDKDLIGSFTNNAVGTRLSNVDISAYLKKAVNNSSAFGIMAIMETAGQSNGTNGWTDCRIAAPVLTVSATESVAPPTEAEGSTAKAQLEDAMNKYNTKMSAIGAADGVIYTNMLPAYNAYLKAVRAIDAFVYGGAAESTLNDAKTTLINAINNMKPYTPAKGTAKGYHYNDIANGGYDNLLYCSKDTQTGSNYVTTGNNNSKIFLPYTAVMLYDGQNPTGYPVVFESKSAKSWGVTQEYILDAVSLESPTTITLKHPWYGYMETGSAWTTWPNKTTSGNDIAYTSSGDSNIQTTHSTPRFYNNEVYYNNTTSNTTTFFDKMARPTFKVKVNNTKTSQVSVNNESTCSYAVNYKVIYDFVTNATRKGELANAIWYKDGGLTQLVTAMDNCTKFDPNSYFTSATDSNIETAVTNCANQIKTLYNATLGINPEPDKYYDQGYQALREALDAEGVMATFRAGNVKKDGSQKYTTESWNNFSNIMTNATNLMKGVVTNGYTSSGNDTAATYASDELMNMDIPTYFAALELLFNPVVTTKLEVQIDLFESFENIFTDETYENAKAVVLAAKEAVWGKEEAYKSVGDALENSTDSVDIVDRQTNNVKEAIKALKFSPDAVITTDYGQYSLNQAIALKDTVADPTDYGNYGMYSDAINAANEYKANLVQADLTDYDTQLAEYVAAVTEAIAAYYSLEYSFTKIPDGTIARPAGNSEIDMFDTHANSGRYWNIKFGYPGAGAVIIRTNHSAKTIKYGQASVFFGTTSARPSNMLDSITIDAGDAQDTLEINTDWALAGSDVWAKALTDAQKQTYAGKLSTAGSNGSTFALKNFEVSETSAYFNKDIYGITENGTTISTKKSPTDEYTKILSTTTGAHASPLPGGIYANSKVSGDQYGSITLVADMEVAIPATTKQKLSATTKPSSIQYILDGKYFGALYVFDLDDTSINWEGYSFMRADAPLSSVVTVVDISYLVELVSECNQLLDTSLIDYSQKYTPETWADFTAALTAAQAPINYSSISATTLTTNCESRYDNLWTAYKALKIREVPVTFNYKDSTGADQSTTINVEWGKQIGKNYGTAETNYADLFNAISTPDYVSADGLYTFKFDKWTPDFNAAAPVKEEASYTATYISELNPANFIPYNASVASLIGALTDRTFTLADLNAIKTELAGMTYFSLTDDEKAALKGDVQGQIDAEKARIDEIKNGLTPSTITVDVAQAAVDAEKACQDIDAYDVDSLTFDYVTPIEVGGKTVEALRFGSQEELDAALRDAVENLNKHQYTIYLNGSPVGTVEYGTPVIINSDGKMFTNVADLSTREHDGSKLLAWAYSYNAPSRNNDDYTPAKYMLTGRSLGFIVKGDTKLTTKNAGNTETGFTVKFMTNDGKVFDVEYTTDGTVTMPTAPAYAYYTFAGYSNGLNAGDTFAVTKNETIIANYTPVLADKLQVDIYNSKGLWDEFSPASVNKYAYGERIDLNVKNTYCWAIAKYDVDLRANIYTILAYGPSYSFLVTKDYYSDEATNVYEGIVALSKADYETILDGDGGASKMLDGAGNQIVSTVVDFVTQYPELQPNVSVLERAIPVYGEDGSLKKISLVGTFALPEGYTIVEAGVLFSSNQAADMTVEKVGTDGIARFKASGHTCGNQFVINVNTPPSAGEFQYKGYATVQGPDGKLVTVYSKAIADGNVNDFRGA